MSPFDFEVQAVDPGSDARAAVLRTPHGPVPTPAFAPVGTLGSVKSLGPDDLEDLEIGLLMTNAYHLAMRPGVATVDALGGLHAISGWRGPIMTDSGGFQVHSLAANRRVTNDGVAFRSHVDGSKHFFTPESVMDMHALLGGDLVMPLDVCSAYPVDRSTAEHDAALTLDWARRSLEHRRRDDQLLYGIVQGSVYPDLRSASARAIAGAGFEAFAVGGVSVGESKAEMLVALEASVPWLPPAAPRHLLGVGEPDDIVEGIARGIDTFDCVVPTRWARHGAAITGYGRLNLRNAVFAHDVSPLEQDCACLACRRFSRGALRHLVLAGEILGLRLLTLHNVHAVNRIMRQARQAVVDGAFEEYRRLWAAWRSGDAGEGVAPARTPRGRRSVPGVSLVAERSKPAGSEPLESDRSLPEPDR